MGMGTRTIPINRYGYVLIHVRYVFIDGYVLVSIHISIHIDKYVYMDIYISTRRFIHIDKYVLSIGTYPSICTCKSMNMYPLIGTYLSLDRGQSPGCEPDRGMLTHFGIQCLCRNETFEIYGNN